MKRANGDASVEIPQSARRGRRVRGAVLATAAAAGLAAGVRPAVAGNTAANWLNPVSGNWTTAADWSTNPNYPNNGTPAGTTYAANISAAGAAYTVTLNSNIAVDTLTLNSSAATLDQTSGTLSANAVNVLAGTYTLDGGTLAGGTLNVSGGSFIANSGTLANVTVTGADLTVTGYLHAQNVSAGTGNLDLSSGATLYLDGPGQTVSGLSVKATGSYATLDLNGNGSLTNYLGQTYTIGSTAALVGPVRVYDEYGSNTLVNQGTVNASGGGALYIQNSYFTNQGLAEATGGGTLNISPNQSWNNAGGTILAGSGSTVNLGGTFTTAGLVLNGSAGTINVTGTANNSGGTFTLNGTTGNVVLSGGTIAGGTVAQTGGATLNVSGGTLANVTVTGADLTVTGYLHAQNVSAGTGNLDLSSGATLYLDGPGQTVSGLSVKATGSYATLDLNGNGSLTNYLGQTYTIGSTAALVGPVRVYDEYGSNTLVNQGTVNASGGGALYIQSSYFTNQGLAEATGGGTLNISPNQSWNNAGGTILAGSGSTVNLGGTFTTAGLVLNGSAGTINVTGTANNSGGTFTLNGTTGNVVLSGGTIAGGTVAQTGGATLNVSGGTLANVTVTGADLTVTGYLHAQNVSAGTGNLDLSSGATLYLDGPGQTVSGLSVKATGSYATLDLNGNGSLTNYLGQTYTIGSTAALVGPVRVYDEYGSNTLVNQGTVNASGGGALYIQNSYFTNQGLAEATGGGTLNISPNQSWNNAGGTILAGSGSTVNLGGTFTTAGLVLNGSAGTINVTGTANNSGGTFTLNGTTGNVVLSGGTIAGGTVAQTGGATLNVSGGTLANVTVTGADLTVTGYLHAQNVSAGTGNLDLSSGATLYLDGPGQTVSGLSVKATGSYATLDLNGNGSLTNYLGQTYTIGSTAALVGPVRVYDEYGSNTLVNQGTVNASGGGALYIQSSYFTNQGLAEATGGGTLNIQPGQSAWNNAGGTVLANGSGSGANVYGTITNTGAVSAANGGTVNLYGTLIGGTANVSGGTFTEQSGSALAGSLALQANGSGGLAVLGNANTYTGGTTVAGGAVVRANSAAGSLGTGITTVNSGGVLAGTGATGGAVTVNTGGTITGGTGATVADTVGTLTTGAQTWNGGGTFYAKANAGTLSNGSSGSAVDELVMSGLTVNSNSSSPFVVDVVGRGSGVSTVPAGTMLVLASVPGGAAGSITSILGDLSLATTNVSFPTNMVGKLAEYDTGGNVDLVLETAAAPEPTALLLAGVAAAPLALGRRRRRP